MQAEAMKGNTHAPTSRNNAFPAMCANTGGFVGKRPPSKCGTVSRSGLNHNGSLSAPEPDRSSIQRDLFN